MKGLPSRALLWRLPHGASSLLPIARLVLIPCAFTIVLLHAFLAVPAFAQVIAEIDGIGEKGLYERRFSLAQDVDATIEAVGSGSSEKDALFAYPWILDLRTRRLVWIFDAERAHETKKKDNLSLRAQVHLPAGDYALYFSALGGSFPVEKTIKVFKIFNLGKVSFSGKNMRWDEVGEPREWHVSVKAEGASMPSVSLPPENLDLGAILRFDRMTNEIDRRALLEVARPVTLRVLAIGEYIADAQGFADGAWILDCSSFERVWEMTLLNTAEAGGARKNRVFDGEITLAPGRYLATCVSDDSHSFEDWNSQPPYDPESWGLTLFPVGAAGASAVTVTFDPLETNLVARIDRVGDSEFRWADFLLKHKARLGVRAFGEWSESADRQVDFGWIEDVRTLDEVWTMEQERGAYASGASRNRIVEESVVLEPGYYRVGYATDNAHSFAGWHSTGPFDPVAWGIRVYGIDPDFQPSWVDASPSEQTLPTMIRLAPMGDDVDKSVRFRTETTTRVRIIALGESSSHKMVDYGWLMDEGRNRTVWEMKYSETEPAGGAPKNRRAEATLTLEPGTYSLHYKSDGSHSFADWNAKPPAKAYSWGVTLLELSGGR